VIDDSIVMSLDAVAQALKLVLERNHVVVEGAAATAVAAALSGQAGSGRIACVVSGGNIDWATLVEVVGSVS
jgi:threonine dehydratase